MSTEETKIPQAVPAAPAAHEPRRFGRARLGLVAIAALALGTAGGAAAMKLAHPPTDTTPAVPATVSTLSEDAMVSLKGKVVEIFGNKFVLEDESGRALVETGPAGEGGKLVTLNEPITIEGRFENGFLHARSLTGADGKTESLRLGPPPPRHGPGPHGPDAWGPRGGPDGGPDGPRALRDGPRGGPGADCGPQRAERSPDQGPDQAGLQPPPPPPAGMAPPAPPAPGDAAAPAPVAPAPAAPAAPAQPQ
ncbi:hypothetical protein BJF93_19165 [Xaviernesmea oryzae]|uniref:Uncharacterized protein n=1 Tax=Xaviernesmea oryzae TaxID=464029 RepID=A0A1Q9B1E4_9HYPH|nr:hypothetical protein [Xaviernesmea oryzae]OLP61814.1 hypothetical protein BJF93_19165 [Xaviernesmea oryzae]SEL76578.1 hypothetical protein SAMN04487976_112108 [Xaviernesmea oryzae]